MRHPIKMFLLAGLCLVLATCGRLPGGAPVAEEITSKSGDTDVDYALYQVNRAFLPTVSQWPVTGNQENLNWIGTSRGARTQLIQPGDIVSLRIWDSSDNSLITVPGQRAVELLNLEIAANGTVFIPYVGNVSLIGLTPDLAREEVQSALERIVPSAQVQLAHAEGRANSIELIGGVATPGTYPMPDRDYTILSLLSDGGGVDINLNNPQIRLVRGGALFGTSVELLLDNPRYDTLLRGGDQVFVEEDNRYFLSFGATGEEDLHIFTKDKISAMDAISIMGGVNDNTADPQGLMILREYPPSAVAPGIRGPRMTRVVFTVDLTSADGLFSARNFQINPNDLVMATESPINDAVTISNVVGNFFGVFSRAGVTF